MDLIFFWGVPLAVAFFGYHRGFYRSFNKFCCLFFAVYLGLWSEPMLSPLIKLIFSGSSAGVQSAITVYVTAVAVFAALVWAFGALNPGKKVYIFPAWAEKGGSLILGLLSGFLLVNFVAVTCCMMPFKTSLPAGLETEKIQARSSGNIIGMTRVFNSLTLQSGNTGACRERLDSIFESADDAAVKFREKVDALEDFSLTQ